MKISIPDFWPFNDLLIIVLIMFVGIQTSSFIGSLRTNDNFGKMMDELRGVHYGMPPEPQSK